MLLLTPLLFYEEKQKNKGFVFYFEGLLQIFNTFVVFYQNSNAFF